MPALRFTLACLATLVAGASDIASAMDPPAYFWLSTSGTAPAGPEAPGIALTEGDADTLYIWARPTPGKRLRNVSLNLIADKSGVDFDDGGFSVVNTITGSVDRFAFTKDSSTSPELLSEWEEVDVASGFTDELFDIQGFTLLDDPDVRGIGPGCLAGDGNCYTATDGDPAWLFGSIDINATTAGVVNLRLQIGDSGINHATVSDGDFNYDGTVDGDDYTLWRMDYGTTSSTADGNGDGVVDAADYTLWRDNLGASSAVESAALTEVVFGVDSLNGVDEPMHNAATDRSTNLAMDDPDAVITIAAAPGLVFSAPEPASALLLATAAGGLINRRKRQPTRFRPQKSTKSAEKRKGITRSPARAPTRRG